MISLPSKRWVKIKLEHQGGDRYLLTVVSPLENLSALEDMVHDEIEACLGEHDSLGAWDWQRKTVGLVIRDLRSFEMKLALKGLIIQDE